MTIPNSTTATKAPAANANLAVNLLSFNLSIMLAGCNPGLRSGATYCQISHRVQEAGYALCELSPKREAAMAAQFDF